VQRDIQTNEIDWVFCWRTGTGEVRARTRDARWNGALLPYRGEDLRQEDGLRTIVRGRVRTCPYPPLGPRLDQQGSISRMCCFMGGHVTHPCVVPARDEHELAVLRDAARAAVRSGEAQEWSLAVIRAGREERWALHIGAPAAVVSELATRIDAPWRLEIGEKRGAWVKGADIVCVDREGRVIETLAADGVFDDAPLPALASSWRAPADAHAEKPRKRGKRGGEIALVYPRPTGPGAWEKWMKADEKK
jgi:hypothetical protein